MAGSPTAAEPPAAEAEPTEVSWHGTVRLIARDKKELDVDSRAAEAAHLVRRLLDERDESDDEVCVVPVDKVESPTLKKLVDYMNRLQTVKQQEVAGTPIAKVEIETWNAKYLDMPIQELFSLMLAGNFMDMPELLEFTCAHLAEQIKGKTPEQLRELFEVENDFSDAEKAEIAAEPKWDFD